jgi:hypothetical protein
LGKEIGPYPVDPLTGLALPVKIKPDDLHYAISTKLGLGIHFHHGNYYKSRPELQGLGGNAVRYARGQFLPEEMHHDAYKGSVHNLLGPTERVPKTASEQIINVALAIAWVIPRDAVQLKALDPLKPVRLNDKFHEFISRPYVTNNEAASERRGAFRKRDIGRFFIEYALQEEFFGDVVTLNQRRGILDAFHSGNESRLKELSHLVIHNSIWAALKPVEPIYRQAKDEGMVNDQKPGLEASIRAVLPEYEFKNYYTQMFELLDPDSITSVDPLQTGENGLELAA